MRKTWVKREHIYYVPFYKQKLKMTLLAVVVMAIVFFAYQIFYIKELQTETDILEKVEIGQEHSAPDKVVAPPATTTTTTTTSTTTVPPPKKPSRILKGIRLTDYSLYNPVVGDIFMCFKSGKEIPRKQINDNYCDCEEDGSDEPETSACPNGVFYCTFQRRHRTGRGPDVSIPSSRINDGICDCCDGSDEWLPGPTGVIADCQNICPKT